MRARCSYITLAAIYFSNLKIQVLAERCGIGENRLSNNTCVDDNECGDEDTTAAALCGANTICYNTPGSFFCTCKHGYSNPSKQSNFTTATNCRDIDECEENPGRCGSNAICTNRFGSFQCTCEDGFVSTTGEVVFTDTKKTQCKGSIHFCPKSSSLVDIDSFAEQSFLRFSTFCKINSKECHDLLSNFLEVMENYTIAASRNLRHKEKKHFISKNIEILIQAIRNNTIPKDERAKLSTAKNSLDIDWHSVAGKGDFDVAAIVLISYKNLDSLFEPKLVETNKKESKLDLISEVITATVTNTDKKHLPKPIILTIENKKFNNETAKCVFWDRSASAWSSHGCNVDKFNTTYTVCNCTHLTSFAVLMALHEIEESDNRNLSVITMVGILVSLVSLLISILTFILCRAIKSIRTTIHTHLCISLFLAELIFIVGIDKTKNQTLCAVIAGFLHYFFLACFVWMLLEGVQLYLMVVKVFNAKSLRPKYMYLVGYGAPLLVVGISACVFSHGYGTKKYCWFGLESGFLWLFLAPVCIIILVNGGFFIVTVWKLVNKFSSFPDMEQFKKIRVFTFTAVAQLCLLGCTWIFGMLHFQKGTTVMTYIFTVVNSLQGMFIFILHCLFNKQVRDEYVKFFLGVCHLKKASKYSEFSTSTSQGLKSMPETGM